MASLGFFLFSLIVTLILAFQIQNGHVEVVPNGAVSSDDGSCSEAGAHMIRLGGTAVDAVVASLLCLSVTQPHLVGPGGGGVVLIYDNRQNTSGIFDFMVQYTSSSSSSGIPGFIKGLKKIHDEYGKLSWITTFQPAINLARNGFIVSESLEKALNKTSSKLSPNLRAEFSDAAKGKLFPRQTYADLLSALSLEESTDFTLAEIDPGVIQFLDKFVDNATKAFEEYEVMERKPMVKYIHNVSVTTAGPPFGGFQLLAGLQLLEELGISPITLSSDLYQAYAKALQVVESNSNFFNKSSLFAGTLSSGVRGDTSAPPDVLPAAQVSIVDSLDVFVGAVVGLGDLFGSGEVTEKGVIMNGISERSSEVEFDGRGVSAFSPLVATQTTEICGQRVLTASSSWSDSLQALSQMVFRNEDLGSAVLEPRISLGEDNDLLLYDFDDKVKMLPAAVREHLKNEGFVLKSQHSPSSVNGVSKFGNNVEAAADPRSRGKVVTMGENRHRSEL